MSEFHGVRIAKPEDVPQIFQFLLPLHEENGLCKIDYPKTYQTVMDLVDPEHGVIGIIDGPQGIEGSVGLFMTSNYYSRDMHLSEMWNYVRPDCRKTTHAKRLIEFAKWCADSLGVTLYMGIVSVDRLDAKQRLYRRQLTPIGVTFIHGMPSLKGEQLSAMADRNREAYKLLEGYHNAVKIIKMLEGKPKNKIWREKMDGAKTALDNAYNKARAVLEDQPRELGLLNVSDEAKHEHAKLTA